MSKSEQHSAAEESRRSFLGAFNRIASTEERWMAAVWTVGEDGKTHVWRTTQNYQAESYPKAVEVLRRNFTEELLEQLNPAPPPPLPMADIASLRKEGTREDGRSGVVRGPFVAMGNEADLQKTAKPEPPPNRETREGSLPAPPDYDVERANKEIANDEGYYGETEG